MKNTPLLFLALLLFQHNLFGQTDYQLEKTFSPEALKEDLSILKDNFEAVHPGLYNYTPKEEFDAFYTQVESQLNEPMSEIEFYRIINPVITLIRNGHTKMVPSDAYVKWMRADVLFFPFDVYWSEGQLYVYRNLSKNEDIPVGAVIDAVDGRAATELFQSMANGITRDGFNISAPEHEAATGFKSYYLINEGASGEFSIDITTPEGESKTMEIKGVSYGDVKKIRKERYAPLPKLLWSSDLPALELKINGEVATMTIRTFDKAFVKKEKKQKFKQFYKDAFEQMEAKGVKHLIIDLRGNGGGDPMPTIELFAHLHPEPFTFYKEVTATTQKIPNKELYTNFSFPEKQVYPMILKKKNGMYHINWLGRLAGVKGLRTSQPNTPYYDGKVYVLTDAESFSATGETTGIIKNFDRAIFIGEEPGGNPVQNTSGLQLILELPNTKVRVVMPLWEWVMNVDFKNEGRGVIPDHAVRPSIQDKIDRVDRVMEYTLELIKEQQN